MFTQVADSRYFQLSSSRSLHEESDFQVKTEEFRRLEVNIHDLLLFCAGPVSCLFISCPYLQSPVHPGPKNNESSESDEHRWIIFLQA